MFTNVQILMLCFTVAGSVWIYVSHAYGDGDAALPKTERAQLRQRLTDVLKEIERVPGFPRELAVELNDIRVSLVEPIKS